MSTPSFTNNVVDEILMKEDSESIDDFVAIDSMFHMESDDDDAPMTKKLVQDDVDNVSQHKKLVEDSSQLIKEASFQPSNILFEINSIASMQETIMTSFQTSFDKKFSKMNKLILSFCALLQN
ncbi:unnamed protein product [Lactuca saligna]|uniref:Uncharacterized protein n=1 Tax=Lactuca saligna TaxID=75948 RepID=A0AA36E8U6_LACSI|nr:unnamed protein product [Lactuca saligna]